MSLPDTIATPRPAFYLAIASNDGANLGATNVLIEVSVRAFDRDPFSSVSIPSHLSTNVKWTHRLNEGSNDLSSPDCLQDEAEKSDLEILAGALRRIKLMHDVESNPGPEDGTSDQLVDRFNFRTH